MRFRVRVADREGRLSEERVEAEGPGAAAALLRARGLAVLEVRRERDLLPRLPRRRDPSWLRELAVLLEAGERLDAALELLARGRRDPALARAHARLRAGTPPARVLAGLDLDPGPRALLVAGERAGRLPDAARRAAELVERRARLRARVRGALLYPLVLAVATFGSLVFVLFWVVPRFSTLFAGREALLPASSRLLFALSAALQEHAAAVASVLCALLALPLFAARIPALAARLQALALRLPLLGALLREKASAEFVRTLALLLEGGVELPVALDEAARAVETAALRARLAEVRTAVARGESPAAALAASGALVPFALHLLAAGERSGRLAATARHAADELEARLSERLERLAKLLEPALVLVAALAVGFTVVSVIGALVSLGGTLPVAGME